MTIIPRSLLRSSNLSGLCYNSPMKILPEPEWERLFDILKKQLCTIFLIGATNSGKSTLARYLITKLRGENIRVSLVDSDVGQPMIGLPGTISMKVFSNGSDIENLMFERMFFVGSTNPAKKNLPNGRWLKKNG